MAPIEEKKNNIPTSNNSKSATTGEYSGIEGKSIEIKIQSDPLETPSTADVFGTERSTDPAKNPFIPNDCAIQEEEESNLSQTSVNDEQSNTIDAPTKPSSLQANTSVGSASLSSSNSGNNGGGARQARERQASLSTTVSTPSPTVESIARRKAPALPQIQIPQLGNGTSAACSTSEDRVPQTAELLTQLASMPGFTPDPFGPLGKTTLSSVKSQLLQTSSSGLSVTAATSDSLVTIGGHSIPSESINKMIGAVAGNTDLQASGPAVSFLSSLPLNTPSQIRVAQPTTVQAQQPVAAAKPPGGDTLVNLAIKVGDRVVNLPLKLTPEQLALATGGGGLSVVPPATLPQAPVQPQQMLQQHQPMSVSNVRRVGVSRQMVTESMDRMVFQDDSLSPPSDSLPGYGGNTSFGSDAELRASQLLRAVAGGGPSASPSFDHIGLSPPPSTPKWTSVQERNKAAAVRYRKRKKDELMALQKRVVELETKNLELNTQVNVLKDELDRVNDILDEHRDCPINTSKRRRIDNSIGQIVVRPSLSSTLAAADSTQTNTSGGHHQQQFVSIDPSLLSHRLTTTSGGALTRTTMATSLGQNGQMATSQAATTFEVGSPAADMLVNALTGTLNGGQASDLSAALGQAIQRQDSTGMGSTLTNMDTGRSTGGATTTSLPVSSAAIVEWLAQQQAASVANASAGTTLTTGQVATSMVQSTPTSLIATSQGQGQPGQSPGIVLQPIMIPGLNHSVLLPYLQLKTEPGQQHSATGGVVTSLSNNNGPPGVGQHVVVVSSGELK